MRTCFVSMPILADLEDLHTAIQLAIRDSLGSQWHCLRADSTRGPGMADERVICSLLNADLVISVVPDLREGYRINPNVMYELGIAHSFRKPTVVISDARFELPFNIQTVQAIQLSFASPDLGAELRKALQRALKDPDLEAELHRRVLPRNPVTTQLRDTRIFLEDLDWLWGYHEVLKREREARTVWEITRDLYWPQERLFFEMLVDSIRHRRKRYYMIRDDDNVRRQAETILTQLELLQLPPSDIRELVHFVAIESHYFELWPITVVLYDADLATAKGGVICEPMEGDVGQDAYDKLIRQTFQQQPKPLDFDRLLRELDELKWTERRREATFDIALDGTVVASLATSFARLWNGKILEEAEELDHEESAFLLNHWRIRG
jgi:hypothetical protein